ncbi:MAG TPA: type II toxin-antitoxin system RelE/ParE family toxin [Telluria sp.]
MPIQSFRNRETERLFDRLPVPRFEAVRHAAERKLQMLDSATSLNFLRRPPGNRLEALRGNRAGQHSIRINDQFRICFVWTADGPREVEIVDYH